MKNGDNRNVQRNYKDTVFRRIFSEKESLLSLYNALGGTAYTDTEELEVTTLEDAVYMNYKNDISFVLDWELMLYEHQSTANPNMPLRDLFYVAKVLQGLTKDANLYGSELVAIPTPKFAVFYNGTDLRPERETLRLSSAYGKKPPVEDGQMGLELCVTVYNINFGHNPELLGACRILGEYAQYVQKVREYAKEMPFPEAVGKAVDYCIRNGILSDFLSKNRAEAIEVSIFEYNEELHIKSEKELSYRQGHKAGVEQGIKQGVEQGIKQGVEQGIKQGVEQGKERLNLLYGKLLSENRLEDLRKSIEDEEYQNRLYEEYGL